MQFLTNVNFSQHHQHPLFQMIVICSCQILLPKKESYQMLKCSVKFPMQSIANNMLFYTYYLDCNNTCIMAYNIKINNIKPMINVMNKFYLYMYIRCVSLV